MNKQEEVPESDVATLETGSIAPSLAGFRWRRADTAAVFGLALILLAAYYPMSLFGRIPLDRDTLTFFYPLLSHLQSADWSLWNVYQLAGSSFVADPQAALFYPPNWIFFFLPTSVGFIVSTLGHYYLAALGIYLLARFSRLSVLSALVAALVFALGGYMSSRLLLRPLLLSAAWFPFVFLCYLYGHYRNVLLGYLFAGVFLALQILAGMPHNAVYSAMAFGFFTLYKMVSELPYRRWRIWFGYPARYLLFLAVAVLLASVVILPTMELLPHTVRSYFGYSEATAGSLNPSWLPDVFIGSSYHQARIDWEFNETNCYLGVIAVWLVLFALFGHWRKGIFSFYLGLVGISLIFALGSHTFIFRLFYHFPYLGRFGVPVFGRFFDIPSRFLGLSAFTLAMLAGYGMEVLSDAPIRRGKGAIGKQARLIVLLLSVGCILWIVILIDMLFRLGGLSNLAELMMNPAGKSDLSRKYFAFANFGFFTLIFGVFTIAFLFGQVRKRIFQILLLVAVVADLLHCGSQVDVPFAKPKDVFRPPIVVRYLQERADPMLRVTGLDMLKTIGGDIKYARMTSILMPKLALLYRLQDVAGYDPLILRRYSELVQRTVGLAPGETPLRVVAWARADHALADLLRVGYVVGEVYEKRIFDGEMKLPPGEHRALSVDVDRPCEAIRFRSVMTGGHMIQQGAEIGRLVLKDASGETLTFPIRAGVETADLYVEAVHYHHPAKRFRTWNQIVADRKIRVHNYVCELPFPRRFRPVQVEFGNSSTAMLVILGIALTEEPGERFEQVYRSRGERIYSNKRVFPPAWWVHDAHVEPSARRVLELMELGKWPGGERIDYRKTALLEKEPLYPLAPSAPSEADRVDVVQWEPDHIVLDVQSEAPGLLVLSEMNYPGWRATIDGYPAEILTADYILRALSLPAGSHRVEMVYRPRSFYLALLASLLTTLLVLLLFLRYRRKFPVRQY